MMNIGRREQIEESEDLAPLEMLAQLFEARGWPCEFVNEDEICGEIQGSWATYQIRGVWRTEDAMQTFDNRDCQPGDRAFMFAAIGSALFMLALVAVLPYMIRN